MKRLLIFLLFVMFLVSSVSAAIIPATSCSQVDVQTAITAASDGDTVEIPSGDCVWSNTITIPDIKGVKIIGEGVGNTRITGTADPKFIIQISSESNTFTRISGIEFYGYDAQAIDIVQTNLWGDRSIRRYRVDNCAFIDHKGMMISGNAYGVIDNCYFEHDSGFYGYWFFVDGRTGKTRWSSNPIDLGFSSWTEDVNSVFGSEYNHYFENNVVNNTGTFSGTQNWMDGVAGGRLAMRDNEFYNVKYGYHGACTSYRRGFGYFEVYNNKWHADTQINCGSTFFSQARGGTGLIFNNSFYVYEPDYNPMNCPTPLHFWEIVYRYPSSTCQVPWSQSCDDQAEWFCLPGMDSCSNGNHAECDYYESLNARCVTLDGQTDSTGYPCRDQFGTAWDGSFETVGMVEHPVVGWSNRYCASQTEKWCTNPSEFAAIQWGADDDPVVSYERNVIDYNSDTGIGTCSDGIDNDGGDGIDMADATCQNFWDDVNNKKKDYTPLQYPHPLTQENIIPEDRLPPSGVWDAGIPGGIPDRQTICETIDSATYGDGVTDATAVIQAAINNCPEGQVVYLPAGEYRTSSEISIQKGITLRGEGPTLTRIILHEETPGRVVWIGNGQYDLGSQNILSGYTKGSNQITVEDGSVYSVGDYLIVTQNDYDDSNNLNPLIEPGGCGWYKRAGRAMGQVVEVTGINGNTLTIDSELYYTYESQYDPEVELTSNNVVEYAGVEDLYLERAVPCGFQGQMIYISNAAYSWVKNIESNKMCGKHIQIARSYKCEVRDSFWHEAFGYGSGGTAYGLSINYYTSDTLATNNIGMYLNVNVMLENTGGGNIVSYNYFDSSWLGEPNSGCPPDNFGCWQLPDISSHCSHPYMDLVEGNFITGFSLDNVWGSASHYTVLRNYIDTDHTYDLIPDHQYSDILMTGGVALLLGYYTNIIGNVIGQQTYPHEPTTERYECTSFSDCNTYQSSRRQMYIFRTDDPRPYATVLRHGNYDYFTEDVVWDPSISSQDIPISLHLTEKPDWWCEETNWPPVDPIGPSVSDIPAKRRYDNQPCTLSTGFQYHEADTNVPFGVIDITELMTYVTDWKYGDGSILMGNVIEAIGHWKAGSYS